MIMYSYLCSLLSSLLWSHIITIRIFVRLGLDTPHSGLDLPSLWPRSPFILASIFPHYGVGPLTTKTHPFKVNAQPIQNKGPPYQHEGLTHQKQNPSLGHPSTLLCHLSTLMGPPTTLLGHPSTHRPPFSLVSIFMHSGIDPFAFWQRARSIAKVKLKPEQKQIDAGLRVDWSRIKGRLTQDWAEKNRNDSLYLVSNKNKL